MAKVDQTYHNLLGEVLSKGYTYEDPNRKGIKRIEIPHYTFYHSFSDGFPVITTKKLAWKSVVGETLWILRGDTNIKYLLNNNINIWNLDCYNYYVKRKHPTHNPFDFKYWIKQLKSNNPKDNEGKIDGDLGKVYGYQLRKFGSYHKGGDNYFLGFDQLKWLVEEMKSNPLSTKKDITYINPLDKDKQALTPCHTGWSILMHKDLSGFDLEFKMSSWDFFLGAPFNIAGYALIAKILEYMTGYRALGIRCNAHNIHIYEPHLDAVKKQLNNKTDKYNNCTLQLNETAELILKGDKSLDEKLNFLIIEDFKLEGYESYPSIKTKMIPYIK